MLKTFVHLNLFSSRNIGFPNLPQTFDVVFLLVKMVHPPTVIRLVIICYQVVDTWPLDKKTRFVWRRRHIALFGSLEAQPGSIAVAENPSQLSRHAAERLWFDGKKYFFSLVFFFCGETVRFYWAPPWRRRRVHKSGDGPQSLAAQSLGRDGGKSSKLKSIISISQTRLIIFFCYRLPAAFSAFVLLIVAGTCQSLQTSPQARL